MANNNGNFGKQLFKAADKLRKNIDVIQKHNFVLTTGRYVGIPDEEDDGILFEDMMTELTQPLAEQMKHEKALDEEIEKQLANIGFKIN